MFHTIQIIIVITDDLTGNQTDPAPSPDHYIAISMLFQYGHQIRPDTLQVRGVIAAVVLPEHCRDLPVAAQSAAPVRQISQQFFGLDVFKMKGDLVREDLKIAESSEKKTF